MSTSNIRALVREIANLKNQVNNMTSPGLKFASVEQGGAITVREPVLDEFGNPALNADGVQEFREVVQMGGQWDGSYATAPLTSGQLPPPTPTMPEVIPVPGGLVIKWDGNYEDSLFAPMNFSRVETHLSPEMNFDSNFAETIVGTTSSPRASYVVVQGLEQGTTYYAKHVCRDQAGARGPDSPENFSNPLPPGTDQETKDAIARAIAGAEQAQATADAAQGTANQAKDDAAAAQTTADGAAAAAAAADAAARAAQDAANLANNEAIRAQTDATTAIEVSGSAADQARSATTLANTAQTTADRKVQTFFGTTAPTSGHTKGDLWIKTNESPYVAYAFNGSSWQVSGDATARTAASTAQAAADAAKAAADKATADAAGALTAAQTAEAKADGKVTTWIQADAPTGLTEAEKGDLWIENDTNPWKTYVWSGTDWVITGDQAARNAAAAAQTAANTAQTTADQKITTFYSSTAPTAKATGDLWVRSTDNRLHRWNGTGWVEVKDAAIEAARAAAADALAKAQSAEAAADGKVTTWIQADAPTGMTADQKGDIWFENDTDPWKSYVWDGTKWAVSGDQAARNAATAAQAAANAAQSTANQKITTYYGATAPTGTLTIGDLWIRAADKRLLRWSGTSWLDAKDSAITDAQVSADEAKALASAAQTDADQALTEAASAAAIADGKVETWIQGTAPTGLTVDNFGDIWFESDVSPWKAWAWDGQAWVESGDPAAQTAATAAQSAAAQAQSTAASAQSTASSAQTAADQAKTTAGTAQTTADQAKSTASTAQATADRKISTYYTANPPVGTFVVGDLWVRSADRRLHRWDGTSWMEVKDEGIVRAESSVLSGNNLVRNGYGTTGTNTNFAAWVADAVDTPNNEPVTASFRRDALIGIWQAGDDPIPISSGVTYDVSMLVRRAGTGSFGATLAIMPLDAYGLQITPLTVYYSANTTTQLAADLKPGDTTVKLTSAANWWGSAARPASQAFLRGIIAWNYRDPGGKTWAKETYSRNYWIDLWDNGGVDTATNTITLRAPWPAANGTLTAGTWVSGTQSGGTYMYGSGTGTANPVATDWSTKLKQALTVKIATSHAVSGAGRGMIWGDFPLPTSAIRIGVYCHSVVTPASLRISAVTFSDVAAAQTIANSKAMTFIQAAAPTSGMTKGDLWFENDVAPWKAWTYDGAAWVESGDPAAQAAAAAAQTTANEAKEIAASKTKIYYGTTPPNFSVGNVGDLYYQRDASTGLIVQVYEFTSDKMWLTRQLNNTVIDSVTAGQIITGVMRANAEIITGDTGGVHSRLGKSSLQVYRPDPDGTPFPTVTLGGAESDSLMITDTNGHTLAGFNGEGNGWANSMSVRSLIVNGRPIGDESPDDVIEALPKGLIARYVPERTSPQADKEMGLCEISFSAKANRMYRIRFAGNFQHTTQTSTYRLHLRQMMSSAGSQAPAPSVPTATNGGSLELVTQIITASGYAMSTGVIEGFTVARGVDGEVRILVSIDRLGGGYPWLLQPTGNHAPGLTVEDLGLTYEAFQNAAGQMTLAGGTAYTTTVSEKDSTVSTTTSPTSTKQTYTKTYNCSWSRQWRAGSVQSSTEIRQGYSSGSKLESAFGFPTQVQTDIAGSTVSKVEVYLYANHWYYNSGGTLWYGVHGFESAPADYPGSYETNQDFNWSTKTGGRWITLPASWNSKFASGSYKGISVGGFVSSSDNKYYGRLNGYGMSYAPKIRITYTK